MAAAGIGHRVWRNRTRGLEWLRPVDRAAVNAPEIEPRRVAISHRVYGDGEPVLLLHGLGGCGLDWSLQLPELERRFRVIVPDLPGCGSSAPPREEYSIEGVASSLWTWLKGLDVARVSIVGFSMGGAIALEMALQRPAHVSRLALINSLAAYGGEWRKWMCARRCSALIRLVGMRQAARMFAAGLFPEAWQQTLRDRAEAVVASVPARTYLSMMRALERWDATYRLERLRCRTLVIAAEHDYMPVEEKRVLAARLGASMVVVHGSRHGTPFDASDATNSSLLALLGDQPLPLRERQVCDAPSRSQAEIMRVRARVLELLADAEGATFREAPIPRAQEMPRNERGVG